VNQALDDGYRRAAAFDSRILHGLVGSTVHGLELVGQDDRDEMGVFVETPDSAQTRMTSTPDSPSIRAPEAGGSVR
jgi:hypothetical protein